MTRTDSCESQGSEARWTTKLNNSVLWYWVDMGETEMRAGNNGNGCYLTGLRNA
jgi:hypothetical protein